MSEIEMKLKDLIVAKYGTMLKFSAEVGIANSTLATIISRGVNNASVNNIIKICKALEISADALSEGRIVPIDRNNAASKDNELIEILTVLKLFVDSNEIKLDGDELTDEDKETLFDWLDMCCEHLRRKHDKKKELQRKESK